MVDPIVDPLATHSKNIEDLIRLASKVFFWAAGCFVICYLVSEHNLFIDETRVKNNIKAKDLTVETVGPDENNLIRFTKVIAYGKSGNKKHYVDAYYTYDIAEKRILRVYETWPVEEVTP